MFNLTMDDLEILKEIEKTLQINFKLYESMPHIISAYGAGYFLKNGKVILLSFESCNISNSSIKKILPGLKKLKSLTQLNLNFNKISNISFLKDLENLEEFSIQNNIIKDTSSFAYVKKLKALNLYDNPIDNFLGIEYLTSLTDLWLGSQIKLDLKVLKELSNLELLYIVDSNISEISWIKNYKKLNRLILRSNKISNIEVLKELKTLDFVDLCDNKIEELPSSISNFNLVIGNMDFIQNKIIKLDGNPIKSPPIEIIKQGKNAIKRYFDKIEKEGVDNIFEAKLILVGEGNAGKTSLQIRIQNNKADLPKNEERTRGIKIDNWTFEKDGDKKHVAHIWDFGGQDVYYPVHRFFLTEDSVFVLLASTRQTGHNFEYWIPTIYQFGGKSPIILGQTCHDGNKINWNDLGYFIGHDNFNIIKTNESSYIELNLPADNKGLLDIKRIIIDQIKALPHYGKNVPKPWISVRNILFEESKKTACITFDKFIEICRESSSSAFTNQIDITDFAKFLHKIGVILWYSEIAELKDWVVLQPEWAMTAVYKIIDDEEILNRNGIILSEDFDRLWTDDCYEGKHFILKEMLKVFKIAFPKKHKKADYIIPTRLVSMPSEAKWTDEEPYLRLVYKYDFMPRGMVNQVSAELSRYITSDEEVWNNAVNLIDNSSHCQIEEDFYKRSITLKAKGKDARGLIKIVMNALKDITDGYKGVEEKILVPCICSECKRKSKPESFPYDKLLDWLSKRDEVKCNESFENILISDLLFNVGLSDPSKENKKDTKNKKLFVSYSKHDDNYLQDFEDHLITLKEEGLVTFNCREIEFGKEWDKEIKKQIDECDIMVCLISVKFLNTEYIKKIEIEKAISQNKMIIPIIIKACDWETSKLGKYQAAQRGRVVSLDNNQRLLGKIKGHTDEEKAAFWTDIIKEFRKKIFN